MRYPIQPLAKDDAGVMRFKANAIVCYLLDAGPFDMNHLAAMDFPREDREQFAQLIGYSLRGFSELEYVSDETFNAAELMAEAEMPELEARVAALEDTLDEIRRGLRVAVPAAFRIHPDDLVDT